MSLESYKLTREYTYSNPQKEMLRDKKQQTNLLYEFAMDREEETLLNGKSFNKSPRIFDRKPVDNIHHKIIVETLYDSDLLECGDYLEFDGMHWLCLHAYNFHKLYCRATFMSCDWKIYWINERGELKSQFVIDQNSTQYNSGESGNSTVTLGAAQHMLKMPCNNDTILLDTPTRFAIDKNILKPTCYKVTQNDNSSYNYGKGLCCITVTETQINNEKDKLVSLEDGSKVWICDHHSLTTPSIEPDKTTVLCALISGNTNLKNGYSRAYTVSFTNREGNEVTDVDFTWNIVSDFDVEQNISGNTIKLKVDDDSLVRESFLLQILVDGIVITEVKIRIIDRF